MIVRLPKLQGTQIPDDYWPITLLNMDYKILARIMAHRLRPMVEEHLRSTQFCRVPGKTILDAVAAV